MYHSNVYDVIAVGIGTGYSLFVFAIAVLSIVAVWKIFTKAGIPGWASLIPIYNVYCLCKITFGSGWMFLLMIIPILNIVIAIMLCFKLAKVFGYGIAFGFGLLVFNTIFILILGFGSNSYIGPDRS